MIADTPSVSTDQLKEALEDIDAYLECWPAAKTDTWSIGDAGTPFIGSLKTLRTAFASARETIRRLNRRAQSVEAGLAEKINENAGRSLGRAFANAAATMYSAQLVDANETISRQSAELALLREPDKDGVA